MSPEVKTPLQLREIQPQPQNNHQPQDKLLFSSPTARRLSAPTRAFTRALCLASQQAALLQLNSFPLQTCSKASLTHPGTHSPPAQARAPGGKKLSSMVCFPTLTSPAHPEKGFAEFAKCLFSGCFPPGGKGRSGKGGKRAGPEPQLL